MMMAYSYLFVLFFLLEANKGWAYSWGAGGCATGPAVSAPHTDGSPIVGLLPDGSLQMSINGRPISPGDYITLPQGVEHELQLSGSDFKGFLFRVGILDQSVINPGNNSVIASICPAYKAVGVCHNTSSVKSMSSATLIFSQSNAGIILEVTVVKSLTPISEYYYGEFYIDVRARRPIRDALCKFAGLFC